MTGPSSRRRAPAVAVAMVVVAAALAAGGAARAGGPIGAGAGARAGAGAPPADQPDAPPGPPPAGAPRAAPQPPPHIDLDAPFAELVTMGQGDDLFEKFGHAALCVTWPGRRRSVCYNYGTTDFSSLGSLFWGFLRGRSRFWVSVSSRGSMLATYHEADRTVWNQVLPLTPRQARALARLLAYDARPENRYYRYNHYTDNCSTRPRDFIDRVTGGALSGTPRGPGGPVAHDRAGDGAAGDGAADDGSPADDQAPAAGAPEPTYREFTRRGLAGQPGLLLLSDLLLGRAADRHPTAYQAMFLPAMLRREVATKLHARPQQVFARRGPGFPHDPGLGGRWVWLVLAVVVAAPVAVSRWRGWRHRRLALAAAAAPLGLLGLVVWAVVILTSVRELRWNEVVLVFVPFDLLLPLWRDRWARRYAGGRVILLAAVSLLRAIGVLVQPLLWLVPIPLGALLLVALGPAPAAAAAGQGPGQAATEPAAPADSPSRAAEPGAEPGAAEDS